ncbi:MAG: hypothetical protein R3185_00140 [Candidatus Thermoplasmatota archaeon]|nr:hypothetical protein [Candidatus Thermoplasmatota archaeon]
MRRFVVLALLLLVVPTVLAQANNTTAPDANATVNETGNETEPTGNETGDGGVELPPHGAEVPWWALGIGGLAFFGAIVVARET